MQIKPDLPELRADLISTLASLDGNEFAHGCTVRAVDACTDNCKTQSRAAKKKYQMIDVTSHQDPVRAHTQ